MMYWAVITFSLAMAFGLMGFGGLAYALAGVAQLLFFVFFLASVVLIAIKFAQMQDDDY